MHDSERYRDNAANCLLAALKSRDPHAKRLTLFIARSWLSLATHDAAVDDLITKWEVEDHRTGVVLEFPASIHGQSAA
jgi:hypothetical protein